MSFIDAVKSVFNQYVGFTGRARRSEYWNWVLFNLAVSVVASVIDRVVFNSSASLGVIGWVSTLALLLPSIAVGARRLHDTGRSGWWLLIGLIPVIGAIVLIVFFVQDSQPDNQYGPSPKGLAAGPVGTPYPAAQ